MYFSDFNCVFSSCRFYVLSSLSVHRRLPFNLLHFVQQIKHMGWRSSNEGYHWHWEKSSSCYCIQAQECLWCFFESLLLLFLFKKNWSLMVHTSRKIRCISFIQEKNNQVWVFKIILSHIFCKYNSLYFLRVYIFVIRSPATVFVT